MARVRERERENSVGKMSSNKIKFILNTSGDLLLLFYFCVPNDNNNHLESHAMVTVAAQRM